MQADIPNAVQLQHQRRHPITSVENAQRKTVEGNLVQERTDHNKPTTNDLQP